VNGSEKRELRILQMTEAQIAHDPIAAAWNTKIVMVTGWYLSWILVGWDTNGDRVFKPIWRAKILEVPDRWFAEMQLVRIL
jgi:hypothetical protein